VKISNRSRKCLELSGAIGATAKSVKNSNFMHAIVQCDGFEMLRTRHSMINLIIRRAKYSIKDCLKIKLHQEVRAKSKEISLELFLPMIRT
jgi:hypothetical protein